MDREPQHHHQQNVSNSKNRDGFILLFGIFYYRGSRKNILILSVKITLLCVSNLDVKTMQRTIKKFSTDKTMFSFSN